MKILICPQRFPLSVRAGPCGRLSLLNPLRQPTARVATIRFIWRSVRLVVAPGGDIMRSFRPSPRPAAPNAFHISRSRAGVVLKNKI